MNGTVLSKAINAMRGDLRTNPEEVFDHEFLQNLSAERKEFWSNFCEKYSAIDPGEEVDGVDFEDYFRRKRRHDRNGSEDDEDDDDDDDISEVEEGYEEEEEDGDDLDGVFPDEFQNNGGSPTPSSAASVISHMSVRQLIQPFKEDLETFIRSQDVRRNAKCCSPSLSAFNTSLSNYGTCSTVLTDHSIGNENSSSMEIDTSSVETSNVETLSVETLNIKTSDVETSNIKVKDAEITQATSFDVSSFMMLTSSSWPIECKMALDERLTCERCEDVLDFPKSYKMYTEPDKDFLCQNCLVHESGHSDCVIPACETCIILSEMLQYREGVSASFLDGTLVVDIPDNLFYISATDLTKDLDGLKLSPAAAAPSRQTPEQNDLSDNSLKGIKMSENDALLEETIKAIESNGKQDVAKPLEAVENTSPRSPNTTPPQAPATTSPDLPTRMTTEMGRPVTADTSIFATCLPSTSDSSKTTMTSEASLSSTSAQNETTQSIEPILNSLHPSPKKTPTKRKRRRTRVTCMPQRRSRPRSTQQQSAKIQSPVSVAIHPHLVLPRLKLPKDSRQFHSSTITITDLKTSLRDSKSGFGHVLLSPEKASSKSRPKGPKSRTGKHFVEIASPTKSKRKDRKISVEKTFAFEPHDDIVSSAKNDASCYEESIVSVSSACSLDSTQSRKSSRGRIPKKLHPIEQSYVYTEPKKSRNSFQKRDSPKLGRRKLDAENSKQLLLETKDGHDAVSSDRRNRLTFSRIIGTSLSPVPDEPTTSITAAAITRTPIPTPAGPLSGSSKSLWTPPLNFSSGEVSASSPVSISTTSKSMSTLPSKRLGKDAPGTPISSNPATADNSPKPNTEAKILAKNVVLADSSASGRKRFVLHSLRMKLKPFS